MGMQNLITAIPIVSLGRSVFYRERAVSMYGVLPYAISAALIEVPYILLQVLLFIPVMYLMVGFETNAETFFYWIVMFICSLANFTFFGQLLVYMTPSPMLAQVSPRTSPLLPPPRALLTLLPLCVCRPLLVLRLASALTLDGGSLLVSREW
jgi:hypothetical protein